MKSITVCLGENLRALRTERGLTQEAFARKADLSLSFVQLIERGKKWVGPRTISVLAKALGVPEARLFLDCDAAPEPDAKQILLVLSHALGLDLGRAAVGRLKVRAPLGQCTALYEAMPDGLGAAFAERCRSDDWDWEKFRAFLRA